MATDLNKKYRSLDQREMGKRIRDRREAMELSREDLAELLDVSAQFIADVEYGNKGLSIKRLYLLSQVLVYRQIIYWQAAYIPLRRMAKRRDSEKR